MDFQERYFDEIKEDLKVLQKQVACLQNDMNEIKGRFRYLYGFAAGVGLIASLAIQWVKVKFFNS